MANIHIMSWQIVTGYPSYSGWEFPGSTIRTFIDDVTFAFSVTVDSVPVIQGSSPPSLFSDGGASTNIFPEPYYFYCDGTTRRQILATTTWPYAQFNNYANDGLCMVAPVCDLEIASDYTVVPATGPSNTDGEIQVSGTSSNGTIEYSLNPSFATVNTTGFFENLLPSTYTVYARDSIGCTDSIEVEVPITIEYGEKYIAEYSNVANTWISKIKIFERAYTGESSEVCCSGNPAIHNYESSNKYTPFIASHLIVELLEPIFGDFQELFTQDDRKFRVDFYKDFGAGEVLIFSGYILPQFYSQRFARGKNEYVQFTASDQLGTLKEFPFRDASDNKYKGLLTQMFLLTEILKKTGLNLNIRIQDNIYEENMVDTSSPFDQAKLDVRIFEDKKCDEALRHLIKCKSGLRLFQAYGIWWLVRSEDNAGEFNYFEYDIDGTLLGSGVYNPVKNRVTPGNTGIMWRDGTQRITSDPNYGIFELTQTLGFDDNFIDEGRFESEDIIELSGGQKEFKNWSFTQGQPGTTRGLQYVNNGDSKGALYIDMSLATGSQVDNHYYSIEIPVDMSVYLPLFDGPGAGLLKVSFQYAAYPAYIVPWVRLGFMLRFEEDVAGTMSAINSPFGLGWTSGEVITDIYISSFGKFDSLEWLVPFGGSGTISLHFFVHNHQGRDFASLTAFRAISGVEDIDTGTKYIINESGESYFYELEFGTDADDFPNVVRSDSYASLGVKKIFRLKGQANLLSTQKLLNKILIDNAKLSFIPNVVSLNTYVEPPEEIIFSETVDKNIRQVYEDEFLLGDLPAVENSKLLFRGHLELLDGTPTGLWSRDTVMEAKSLMQINLDDRISQMRAPADLIEANLLMKGVFYSFLDCLQYDERFLNIGYSLDDKNSSISSTLVKERTGEGGEPPVEDAAFTLGFSLGFEA